jgi:hypothetical protein
MSDLVERMALKIAEAEIEYFGPKSSLVQCQSWALCPDCYRNAARAVIALARKEALEEIVYWKSRALAAEAETDRQNNRYAEMSAEADRLSKMVTAFREQDEAIRSEFGGKRDGRPTIECVLEAFAAKWSEEDALFQTTLNEKTEDLRDEVARLAAENAQLRALLKRHFARKPEPECQIVDAKRCIACVCGWTKWKLDEMALEDETRAALQDKSDELKGDAVETESGRT